VEPARQRPRTWRRTGAAAALALAGLSGCGDDSDSAGTTTVPTTPRPIEEYRTQYVELLTANLCSDQETEAVQAEIAPDGTVGPGDFPALKTRLFPAWVARSEAIADFQDGLASNDWSDELTPLVDELIADLEESRASYRAAAQLETFDAFAKFVFPADGVGEGKLREALDLAPDRDDAIDWCAGVPDLGPTTTTTAPAVVDSTTSTSVAGVADGSVPDESTTSTTS
jgi:hypothetical protein